jgi:hypothetical protein
VTGFGAVAGLRFREALAGRAFWLLPIHFFLALAAARTVPGATAGDRAAAADGAALGLAALLACAAAAAWGAAPLAGEREPRGTLVLAAPVSAAARVLGAALGTGAALTLLVLALAASSLAATDLGAGVRPEPTAFLRASSLEGGVPDGRDPALLWRTEERPAATARFERAGRGGVRIAARPRVGRGGTMPGTKLARIRFPGSDPDAVVRSRGGLPSVLAAAAPPGTTEVAVERVEGNLDLGLRREGVRLEDGPRPRAWARLLHAAALAGGVLAVMAAALALSTVAGPSVAAAGALALAALACFRSLFADAASILLHAGAMERAVAAETAGHAHDAGTGTPPSWGPLFRLLAEVLPDGTSFDLAAPVAANEVPDPGEAGAALLRGGLLAAALLAAAILGARRRP